MRRRMNNPPRIVTMPPHDLPHPVHPTSYRHPYCQQQSQDQTTCHQPIRNSQYPSPASAIELPWSASTSHESSPAGNPTSPNEPAYKYASASCHEAFSREGNTYSLTIIQQPQRSRMVGSGDKADRRPLDPPPILKFEVSQSNGRDSSVDPTLLRSPYFMCYCTLCEASAPYKELYTIPHSNKPYMVGSIVTSMFQLRAGDKESGISEGHYFVFPDVGIRVEGSYRLKFSVYEIVDSKVYLCNSIMSEKVHVFTPKSFPGMDLSTEVSHLFVSQGLRMRVRTKNLNVPVLGENFKSVAAGSKKIQNKRRVADDESEKVISPRHPVQPPKLTSDNQHQFYPCPAAIKSLPPPETYPRPGGYRKPALPSVTCMLKGMRPDSISRNPLWPEGPPNT